MAARAQHDGFHEIELNGKQLVFLVMAASVVAVVIFLLGVFVGRGVRTERASVALAAALAETPAPDPGASRSISAASDRPQPGVDPTSVATPPGPVDDLSYISRLESEGPKRDEKTPAAPKPSGSAADSAPAAGASPVSATSGSAPSVAAPSGPAPSVSPATPFKPAPAKAVSDSREPVPPGSPISSASGVPGDGYAVQVAALNVRGDADVIARRLSSKGYPAYVQEPPNGTGAVFRVRVGTFKTRREAETVAARLQKEEQIKPWVTR